MTIFDPAAAAEAATQAILTDFRSGPHRGVVVNSPPGAGKSTLVVRAAAELVESGEQLMIVAQTNEQVDDLTLKLSQRLPGALIGRLSSAGYVPAARIAGLANVACDKDVAALSGCAVTIATAAKWAYVKDRSWQWAIIDEAYQMRSDALLAIAALFERALFVGDPGQLDPFSVVENDRWRGLTWDPMQSAVAGLLRNNPGLPEHQLPVSWRLPVSAEPVIAPAFYPFTGFRTGTGPGDRELTFSTRAFGRTPVDAVLEEAATSGWGYLELPARHTMRTDAEAVAAVAAVARRFVERGAVARSGSSSGPVTPERIAVGAAHRDQVAALQAALTDVPGITVDTANRLQGREYEVTVVLHPLSGRRDATAFHLEAGRLCVLASRHRQACVLVGRAGIHELLDAHPSAEPVHLYEPVKFPDGWAANQSVMTYLEKHRIPM
ncbi:helicase [Actinoplanes lobatus]|uniref:Helicase n=1 Tax=Actinoplanes lobatus TaxID=113568 RepID=A0A7W7HR30_9ACTN|nr:AAA family ATPase [Actinoplanes lobatus]MBB4755141.1 putative lipoic acid-binding regulatory protein [Actinoplanes lobatus]GGN96479.1 helicase [Actinoplanes lobatus]GIE45386.1 helicase [Actinoplanes lobatus]